MRIDTLMLVLAAVLFSGAGQLLLKTGTRQLAGQGQVGFLFAAFRNPHVVSGLVAWS